MDCRTARLLLDFERPRVPELPPDDASALDAHLAGCPECEALAQADRAADARLGQAMRDVAVPEGLHQRILERLETERGDQRRRWLGWTMRVAAAAAAVMLAVWLGFAWYTNRPRPLDLERLHADVFTDYGSPSQQKVEAWFLEHYHLNTVAPASFNYRYLRHYDLALCQDRRVPFLLFANGNAEARVYVVSAKEFDMKELAQAEPIDSAGYQVKVVREDPDHAFVIVFTGESLQPLLVDDSAAH